MRISVAPLDEAEISNDIDGDGSQSIAIEVNVRSDFAGAANGYFSAPYIYPLNTEFLYSGGWNCRS